MMKNSRGSRSPLPRISVLSALIATTLALVGCDGPASTVFNSAAPSQATVPYLADTTSANQAVVAGVRGKDGREAWRTTIDASYNLGAMVVANGVLYFGGAVPPTPSNGFIVALRISDGQTLWRTTLPVQGMAATGALVVIAAGSAGLYALNAADGTIRWHNTTPADGAPQIVGDVVVVNMDNGKGVNAKGLSGAITGVRASDGTRLWQTTVPGTLTSNQFAVYTTVGDDTFAFAVRDGHQLWDDTSGHYVPGNEADDYHGEVVAVSDQLALVQEGFADATKDYLAALDARTGALRWKYAPGFEGKLGVGGPIFGAAGDAPIIYGAYRQQLMALRAADGTRLWKDDLASYAVQQLAYADGVVFALIYPPPCGLGCWFSSSNMRLEALNAATGAVYWQRDLPDALMLASDG